MKTTLVALFAAIALPAAAVQAAGPVSADAAATSAEGQMRLAQFVGGRDGREASGDCKPYNGPYGYYGNPYCEGGFNRYGRSGGYEIDLTRYFDSRYYADDRRDRRRWR